MHLEGLSKYTCSSMAALDDKWKDAVAFGQVKKYSDSKIFNKALGDIEDATKDLDTIACVSATVLHILKFSK